MAKQYVVIDKEFSKDVDYGNDPYLTNWPGLYILENGNKAYVGQSNHLIQRMSQHSKDPKKEQFNKVHFIYANHFNQSVTFDYESKLIKCLAADDVFSITNENGGIADKDYFGKKDYDKEFPDLWRKLVKKDLAKKSLEEIFNSDLFKYSPFTELNNDQRETVDTIIECLKSDDVSRVIVNGIPGSGKTIVAVYLMKYLTDASLSNDLDDQPFKNLKIGFVVPQTSLRTTMSNIFRDINNLSPKQIVSPIDVTKEKYDILIVDEAHRLHQYKNISYMGKFKEACERIGLDTTADELDWILKQSKHTVLMYDQNQVVGPSGIDSDRFKEKFANEDNLGKIQYTTLRTEMRVAGGNDYIRFVQDLINGVLDHKYENEMYDLKLFTDFSKFEKTLYEKESECGLCRMVAGYAWPWISKNDKSLKDITIDGVSRMWNNKTEGWMPMKQAIDEVGCIHSIQGYDLNYAFVIIGKDLMYDNSTHQVYTNKNNYFDKNGKRTLKDDNELLDFIKNIYYVLLTRGIKGTYIYVCDDNYRDYLSKYIEVVN